MDYRPSDAVAFVQIVTGIAGVIDQHWVLCFLNHWGDHDQPLLAF